MKKKDFFCQFKQDANDWSMRSATEENGHQLKEGCTLLETATSCFFSASEKFSLIFSPFHSRHWFVMSSSSKPNFIASSADDCRSMQEERLQEPVRRNWVSMGAGESGCLDAKNKFQSRLIGETSGLMAGKAPLAGVRGKARNRKIEAISKS